MQLSLFENQGTLQARVTDALQRRLTPEIQAPEFSFKWKMQAMPTGDSIPALRAKAHKRTVLPWRTAQAEDGVRGPCAEPSPQAGMHSLTTEARLAQWPTAQSRDGDPSGRGASADRTGGERRNLDDYALLAGWPTATAETQSTSERAQTGRETAGPSRGGPSYGIADIAMLSPYPTPDAGVYEAADQEQMEARRAALAEQYGTNGFGLTIGQMVPSMMPYPTPRHNENDQGGENLESIVEAGSSWLGQNRGATMATASGLLPPPSSAATGSTAGYRLNPGFSLWLMLGDLAPAWLRAGMRVQKTSTRSRRKDTPTGQLSFAEQATPSCPE